MKYSILLMFFVLSWGICFSQNNEIDSLSQKLAVSKPDTNQVNILIRLSSQYRQVKPDSANIFGEKALNLAKQLNFTSGEIRALSQLSSLFRVQGDYPKSLELRLKALKIIEEKLPQMDKNPIWSGIGLVYLEINDYSKAIAYFRKALEGGENINNGNVLQNMARSYFRSNQLDSALHYAQKVYEWSKAYSGSNAIYLMDMGIIQFQLGNQNLAFEYLLKSILKNPKYDHRTESDIYGTISGFFKETNQTDSCIFYAQKGLIEGQTIGYQKGILINASLLAESYESKDLNQALYYHKIAKAANEELYGVKKFQSLQKNITDELERQREIEAETIAKENQLKLYFLLAGLVIILLIAFILYRNNRQKQKANIILQEQKNKVESTLSQLKVTQSQLIQSEKMASLGELTAGIAHEIQNPLNFVNNFSEVSAELVKDMVEEVGNGNTKEVKAIAIDVVQNLEKINHHGQRASAIVKGMLEHSRKSTGEKEATNINALCDEYLRLAYHGLKAKDNDFNAKMETHFDTNLPNTNIIPQEIGRVILNLINNAFYAVNERNKKGEEGYEPTVSITTQVIANSKLSISVKDNGNGIPDSIKDKIFQPFFTTKPTGQGTGLGLSLAYDIVKAHSGEIKVMSKEGEGTEFIIQLPISESRF